MVNGGYHAMNSLRIEKGYRHWGDDMTDEDTPFEAGVGFAVALGKAGELNGRSRLQQQKEQGVTKRLVQFALEDENFLLYHNEPIWRDNEMVGYIASGMFGHTIGAAIGLGYVKNGGQVVTADFVNNGRYEIEVANVRVPARASLRPFYDPKSERVKA